MNETSTPSWPDPPEGFKRSLLRRNPPVYESVVGPRRLIYAHEDGAFSISIRQVWVPGAYADINSAIIAFTRTDEELNRLQSIANERGDHVITAADLALTYNLPTST